MRKFSILIANFNNGKYFKECYETIINQTYKNWEVIIVDDASTDDSLMVILNTIKSDQRFKLFQNKENKGCGYTKMKCIEYATGDICAFLDPDDALYSNALELSVRAFDKNHNIIATYSNMMLCDEYLGAQKIFGNIKQIYNNRYFFNCPIQLSHFFCFCRKTYLKTEGINPKLKNAVDQDLYLKVLEMGNALFIKEVLYKYRIHKNGISQDRSKQSAKESFSRIILEAMHRRGIKMINNQKVPKSYKNSHEIYGLLTYQNNILYRLKTRILALLCR